MIMKCRALLLSLFLPGCLLVGFCFGTLKPFQLFVQNSVEDMVVSKRILVRVELDKSDQYIYKDSLRFSIDVPGIELTSWHASIHPTTQYSLLFKRNKLIYPESFTAEITFTLGDRSLEPEHLPGHVQEHQEHIVDRLTDANMYVACLVYGKDGKNKAQTVMVSCHQHKNHKNHKNHNESKQAGLFSASESFEDEHSHDRRDRQDNGDNNEVRIESLGSEIIFFNELFVVWQKLTEPVKQFIGTSSFFIWYMIVLLLCILFAIKPYFRWMRFVIPVRGIWEKEIKRFLLVLVTSASFYFVSFLVALHIVLYSFACFLLLCSLYYLKETAYSTTFLGKLKIIIGFFCALP